MPLEVALGHYMGVPVDTSNYAAFNRSKVGDAFAQHFNCPASDGDSFGGMTFSSAAVGWWSKMSYGINAVVLGEVAPHGVSPGFTGGLMGNVRHVRRPSEVFLFVDAGGGYPPMDGLRLWKGQTLYDQWRLQGPSSLGPFGRRMPQLPHAWHRNRVNVAFVDGHCETLMLPLDWSRIGIPIDQAGKGDLERAGIWKGIYE
jgi:prepilin-type processing-associated H-X9-DG protein